MISTVQEAKRKIDFKALHDLKVLLREARLHTVCEEAKCPNIVECFQRPTATFLILGDICTRNCRFCSIKKGKPGPVDPYEPLNLAITSKKLGLKHVVITSVTRDDLPDGGAEIFARSVKFVRDLTGASVEVLTPDFKGDRGALDTVIESRPDIFNHNVETVPSLYRRVRPMADYRRSLEVLRYVKERSPDILVKSGLMVGLGETPEEVMDVMRDLKEAGCDIITIGQYFQPTKKNLAVTRFVPEKEYNEYKKFGETIGVRYVFAGTYVRSSYNAYSVFRELREALV